MSAAQLALFVGTDAVPCEACGGWGVVGPPEFRFTCAECDGTGWTNEEDR